MWIVIGSNRINTKGNRVQESKPGSELFTDLDEWFPLLEWTVPWGWFDSNNYRDEVNSTNGNTNLCRLLTRAFQKDTIFCRLAPRTQTPEKQALSSSVSPPRVGHREPLIPQTSCSWVIFALRGVWMRNLHFQIKYWCIPKQINALMNSELCQWAEHLWKSLTKVLFLKLRCLCTDWIVPVRYVQERNHEFKGFTLGKGFLFWKCLRCLAGFIVANLWPQATIFKIYFSQEWLFLSPWKGPYQMYFWVNSSYIFY